MKIPLKTLETAGDTSPEAGEAPQNSQVLIVSTYTARSIRQMFAGAGLDLRQVDLTFHINYDIKYRMGAV